MEISASEYLQHGNSAHGVTRHICAADLRALALHECCLRLLFASPETLEAVHGIRGKLSYSLEILDPQPVSANPVRYREANGDGRYCLELCRCAQLTGNDTPENVQYVYDSF